MDDGIRVPSADTVIRAGGWHPKYARVLLIEHNGDHGDGADAQTPRQLVAQQTVLTINQPVGPCPELQIVEPASYDVPDAAARIGTSPS